MYVCAVHACTALLKVAYLVSLSACSFRLSDRDHQLVQVRRASELMRAQLSSKEESLSLVQAECIELSQQLETLRYADTFSGK